MAISSQEKEKNCAKKTLFIMAEIGLQWILNYSLNE